MPPSLQAVPPPQQLQGLSWVVCVLAFAAFMAALVIKWQSPYSKETGDASQTLSQEQASPIITFDTPAALHYVPIFHDAFGHGGVSQERDLQTSYGSALPGVSAHSFYIDMDLSSEFDVSHHIVAENIDGVAAMDREEDHHRRHNYDVQQRHKAGSPKASVREPIQKLDVQGASDSAQTAKHVDQLEHAGKPPPEVAVPEVLATESMKTLNELSFVSAQIVRLKDEEALEQDLATSTTLIDELSLQRFALCGFVVTMLAVLLALYWFLAPARPQLAAGGVGVAPPKKKEVDGSAAPDAALPKKKLHCSAAPEASSPPAKPRRQHPRWAKENLALALLCYVPGSFSLPFAGRPSHGMGKGRGSLPLSRAHAQEVKGAPLEAGCIPEPKKTRRSRAATPEHKSSGTRVYQAPKMYLDRRNQDADRLKAYKFKSRRLQEVADREIARQVASAADAQEAQCQSP